MGSSIDVDRILDLLDMLEQEYLKRLVRDPNDPYTKATVMSKRSTLDRVRNGIMLLLEGEQPWERGE